MANNDLNLDLKFFESVLTTGDFLKAQEQHITDDYFSPEILPVWRFIKEYYEQYRLVPTFDIVNQRFGLTLEKTDDDSRYWTDELKKRRLYEKLEEASLAVSDHMNKKDPLKAYEFLKDFISEQENIRALENRPATLTSLKAQVKEQYLDAKSGKMGIPTPFQTLNDWTMGWFKQDFSVLVGRAGVGKSFFMLKLAECARAAGHSVLLVSCEMRALDMASRFYGLQFKKNYSSLRRGRLSGSQELDFFKDLSSWKPDVDIEIVDGSQGLRSVDIERLFRISKAEIVLIDSYYRIKANQKTRDRFENMAAVTEEIKLFSQVYDKAVIASSQLNRGASDKKKGASIAQDDIAMSDVINWTATNILGLTQDEDDKKNKEMKLTPIKVRESANYGEPLILTWDFERMVLEEKVEVKGTGWKGAYEDEEDNY